MLRMNHTISSILAVAALSLCVPTAHADLIRANVILQEGDSPPGADGFEILNVNNPFSNSRGEIAAICQLDSNDHGVWVDGQIVWMGDNETNQNVFLSTSSDQRYTMGHSDAGDWVYLPDVDNDNTLWGPNGPLISRYDPAPAIEGAEITHIRRVRMTPNGEMFWLTEISTDTDTSSEGRVLYVTPDVDDIANSIPLLVTGDELDGGFQLEDAFPYGIDYDFGISPSGNHYIQVVDLENELVSADDTAVVVNGQVVLQEGVTTAASGSALSVVYMTTINDQGNYLTTGYTKASEDFIAYNRTILVAAGINSDFNGVTMSASAVPIGVAMNNNNAAVHLWRDSSIDHMFYSSDASKMDINSHLIVKEDDELDFNNDGVADARVEGFTTSATTDLGVVLTDTGLIYLELNLDTTGNGFGDTFALVEFVVDICGDGVVVDGEQCDDGTETVNCNANCTFPYCGDGVVNAAAGEGCDGAGMETADCDIDCSLPECGDGISNAAAGEVCDTGIESAECDSDCSIPECGDNVLNVAAGEDCDEGAVNTATCDENCTFPTCGDGLWNLEAGEDCDEGEATITCDVDCTPPSCGDEVVNPATGEDCDDGAINTESCDQDCTAVACGDGYTNLTAGEECDDSGESSLCDIDCTRVTCGDGVVNESVGEICDDGGESATCNANCTAAVCGDLQINETAGEECDDGNSVEGDGCANDCQIETTTGSGGCHAGPTRPESLFGGLLLLGFVLLGLRRRRIDA